DGAVDLRAGKVERLGNQWDCSLWHAAERLLHFVQDRKDCAFHVSAAGDDFARALSGPSFISRHSGAASYLVEKCEKNCVKSTKRANRPIGFFYRSRSAPTRPSGEALPPQSHRACTRPTQRQKAKFLFIYNCLSPDRESRSSPLWAWLGRRSLAPLWARDAGHRTFAAQDRRQQLGLGDKRIDQGCQRVAVRHDKPD